MRRGWVAISLLVLSLGLSLPVRAEEIIVSAAASLTDALREIGKIYESRTQDKVALNFGNSAALARQIEEGAPADIFFSADLEKMDLLEKNGRVDSATRRNLLSNQLVLIVPSDSKLAVRSPKDLLQPGVKRIALAEPNAAPVGIYTRKYLEAEGLWERVKEKIIPVLDVRAALASVVSGNVEAGFLYKTDAALSKRVKVVYEVPIEKGPKILYPVAVVKDSKKKDAARGYVNFLSSEPGKSVFKKYGFVVLE